MKVLLIKLSSMGDIIQTLPAITEAWQNVKGLSFDWVVEQSFAEIPLWHPAINDTVIVNIRKQKAQGIAQAIKAIRKKKYDKVIDAQSLIKSAFLCKMAKSNCKSGLSWQSAREPLASLAYNNKHAVNQNIHVIDMQKQFFAKIFDYSIKPGHDYGIKWSKFYSTATQEKYWFFLHGTTWDSKHWPFEHWSKLCEHAKLRKVKVKVTWSTPQQKLRAHLLASKHSCVEIVPMMPLSEAINIIQNAEAIVSVDTGFAHLACAMQKPIIALFGPTNTTTSGVFNPESIMLQPKLTCCPCIKRSCPLGKTDSNQVPLCMWEITPQEVIQSIDKQLDKKLHL